MTLKRECGIFMELVRNRKYSLNDLLDLVNLLRSPKGCPWDRVQTHSSIRSNLIEEAYDAVEAIDLSDSDMLKEELGDVLLQIAFHCSIEEEEDNFSFADVIDSVCRKIILRHPHVFADSDSSESGRRIYDLREREKQRDSMKVRSRAETPAEGVKNVSKILPALMRTTKVQGRAARAGYGLFSVEDAVNETFERLHYLETLILDGRQEDYNKEIGDLLFSVTEISRLVNVDAESALYDSCERFKDEFLYKISLENRNKV
jgi:tetrapyrrole methylase family protein/MazG family protein